MLGSSSLKHGAATARANGSRSFCLVLAFHAKAVQDRKFGRGWPGLHDLYADLDKVRAGVSLEHPPPREAFVMEPKTTPYTQHKARLSSGEP